jgi:pimeloyl-ACP methyl ester carboxylesterase
MLGAISIKGLTDRGYNVLTWDPRGFGESTGTAQVDSPDVEARDVQQLIDWVATQPQAQLDGTRDPRMGLVGGSYGGAANGTFSKQAANWFIARGPADSVAKIEVPTLIIQGTVDTVFTLDEAVSNYRLMQQAGTTVAMVWFCGGHGVCLTNRGDPKLADTAALAWLVDPSTGLVLGDQITPIAMTFDRAPHSVDVPLEMIAHDFVAGSSLTLQLVATTVAYVQPRLGGDVKFSTISISLPVVTSATKLG